MPKSDQPGNVASHVRSLTVGWNVSDTFRDEKVGDFKVRVASGERPVSIGGLIDVPRAFTIEPRDKKRPLIDVEVEGGRAACVAVRRQPGGSPLGTLSVRQPIDAFVKAAVYAIAIEPTGERSGGIEVWKFARGRRTKVDFEKLVSERRRGVRLSDDFLQKVALAYRTAVAEGRPPTQAVADEVPGSRSSAGRWVFEARKRGFLGATTRRQAGERREKK
jgi:hypothetical protein